MNYWLLKSEPTCYSIDDLKNDTTAPWDGVRNYQARNFMQEMKKGDKVLFYHSSTTPPGVAGLATVHKEAYPDYTAWDPHSDHPDPQSPEDNPRWFMVDVAFKKKFDEVVPIGVLRNEPALADMMILQKGSRLSVTPVTKEEYEAVVELATSH